METARNHLSMRQTEWAAMSLSLHWVYEGEVPGDGRGRRRNDNLAAWLLRKGEARVRMEDGREAAGRAGDWLFLPGGTREQTFSEDARILSICWRAFWPDGRNLFNHGLPVTLSAPDHPRLETTAGKLFRYHLDNFTGPQKFLPRSRGGAPLTLKAYLKVEALLVQWLDQVADALASRGVHPATHEIPDDRVLLALELLEKDPLRKRIGVGDVAKAVGLSVSQLDRLFLRHVGHTPKAHLQARKRSEARNLLADGDLTMKEISYRLGFSSSNAFYNWFRKETGRSPSSVKREGGVPAITPDR